MRYDIGRTRIVFPVQATAVALLDITQDGDSSQNPMIRVLDRGQPQRRNKR